MKAKNQNQLDIFADFPEPEPVAASFKDSAAKIASPEKKGFQDVYSRITDKIIAELEKGERPWLKPWNAEHAAGKITRPLRHNGQPYSGINVFMLWMEAMNQGYAAPLWMTFKQALELGGAIRKGEKGSLVVYANTLTKTEKDKDTGEDTELKIPFMKGYTVFNVEQIDGLPPHFYATAEAPKIDPAQKLEHAEQFFKNTGATIKHGGNRAFYAIGPDYIQMPPFEFFKDPESHYSTLAHKNTHWTRHETRLNRDLGRKKWGDEGYAMEELVAEMGSAFLGADLGITPESLERSCRLYWQLAQGLERGQTGSIQRSSSRAEGGGISEQPATRRRSETGKARPKNLRDSNPL